MKCLFMIQGEGRGHLTQALALQAALHEAGHEVVRIVVGQNQRRALPSFFADGTTVPIHRVPSPTFVADAARRGVRPGATLWNGLQHLARLPARIDALDAHVQQTRPDVVINFFEPLAGLYYGLHRPDLPMVCIAHQYMFLHPAYRFPGGWPLSRRGAQAFAHLTAWGATKRLALSLYPAADLPERNLTVMPPLLRPAVFDLTPTTRPFLLMYLLNRGYVADVRRWHARHPGTEVHCFVDRPGAPDVERCGGALTLHQLDGQKFLSMMAQCRGLICTAGFESVAEAMYLGKPVQVVPVEGHFEQHGNAHDVERAGAGCWTPGFNLDPMLRMTAQDRKPDDAFRRWVSAGRRQFVRAIETAARTPHQASVPTAPSLRKAPFAYPEAAAVAGSVGDDPTAGREAT